MFCKVSEDVEEVKPCCEVSMFVLFDDSIMFSCAGETVSMALVSSTPPSRSPVELIWLVASAVKLELFGNGRAWLNNGCTIALGKATFNICC